MFKKNKDQCPIDEETRIWMENAFIWLINQFGEERILSIITLRPTENDFPIQFDGETGTAIEVVKIVSKQMDVNPEHISLDFYDQSLLEIRGGPGLTIIGQQYEDENYSSGMYSGRNNNGKFNISIEINQVKDPENLIATLSHEIAHIKILGEERLKENDEYLTDLVTVFFGLGIFNANASFKVFSTQEKWGYHKQGYLTQQEWGYALALYAYIRNEIDPEWLKFLTPNIKSDFKKSLSYNLNNRDKVLC